MDYRELNEHIDTYTAGRHFCAQTEGVAGTGVGCYTAQSLLTNTYWKITVAVSDRRNQGD